MFWPLAVLLLFYGYIAGVAYLAWRIWQKREDVLLPVEEMIRRILEGRGK